jgi:hypothetical protein
MIAHWAVLAAAALTILVAATVAAALAVFTGQAAQGSAAIDLSAFTHSQAPAPPRPDFAGFLLPLAALLVITALALAYEVRSGRGRGVAVTMRT